MYPVFKQHRMIQIVLYLMKSLPGSSGTQSVPACALCLANLKCNFAKNHLLVRAACDCEAATVAGKVTRGLTNPAGTAADANPSVPSHSPPASEPAFLSHFIAYFQNSSTVLHIVLYFLILKP